MSICVLALVTFISQRFALMYLNAQKTKKWQSMSTEEQAAYQLDTTSRELEGNRRLDFLFKY